MASLLACCALDAGIIIYLLLFILALGLVSTSISCLCCAIPWGKAPAAKYANAVVFTAMTILAILF